METISLTVPEIIPQISTSIYKIISLTFDWEQPQILITLRGEHNEIKSFIYGGSNGTTADKLKATNLMIALNKVNLSVKSLQRRVIEQLVLDGLIAGSVSGIPD